MGTGKTNLESALCCGSDRKAETQPSCAFSVFLWGKTSPYNGLCMGSAPAPHPVPFLASSPTALISPLLAALQCEAPCSSLFATGMLCTGWSLCLEQPSPKYVITNSHIFTSSLKHHLINQVIPDHQAWFKHTVVADAALAIFLGGGKLQG